MSNENCVTGVKKAAGIGALFAWLMITRSISCCSILKTRIQNYLEFFLENILVKWDLSHGGAAGRLEVEEQEGDQGGAEQTQHLKYNNQHF